MKTLATEFIYDGTPYRIIERTATRYFAERLSPRGLGGNYETGRIVRDDDGNEQIVGDKEFGIDPFSCETVTESAAYQNYLTGKQHDDDVKFDAEHAHDMAMFVADDARIKNIINQTKANTMDKIKRSFYRNGFQYDLIARKGMHAAYSMSKSNRIIMYEIFDIITDANGVESLGSSERRDLIYDYKSLTRIWEHVGNGLTVKKPMP